MGLEEVLKDDIDEESEGNDYVLDKYLDQDSTDGSEDDVGEGDDATANGMCLCLCVTITYFFLFNIYVGMNKHLQTDD